MNVEVNVVASRKSICFGISTRILYFHIVFMSYALYFTIMYFHTVLSMFRFFFNDRTRKQTLLVKQFSFVFIKGRPSVSETYNL